jgi:hypothetical protein
MGMFMKGIVTSAVLLLCMQSTTAQAVSLDLLGVVGYESQKINLPSSNTLTDRSIRELSLGGLGVGVLANLRIVPLTAGTDLIGGVNLAYNTASGDNSGQNVTLKQALFGLHGGIAVQAAPRFELQTSLGYEFGLSGEYELKPSSGLTLSGDTSDYGRITSDWRAMFKVNPRFGVGFNVGWYAGSFQTKVSEGDYTLRGMGFRAVLGYTF